MAISRACYATREQVRRETDIYQASYSDARLDRVLGSASGSVDQLCQRKFYPLLTTYHWDWPNYQYAYPWRLWFNQRELACDPYSAPGGMIESGTFLPEPIPIPLGQYILKPEDGPPYTNIELRRDLNATFGNNTTPQMDTGITCYFGYWLETEPAGTIITALTDTVMNIIQVSDSALVDAGNTLVIDDERMLVTDTSYISTGITWTSGCTTASAADNTMEVPDGTQFSQQEVILVDNEWMLIQYIIGNNMIMKRAFSGSVLSAHTPGPILAKRLMTVKRGFLGTTATTHSADAPLAIDSVPSLVNELCIAEATVQLVQGKSGYANTQQASWYGQVQTGQGQQKEPVPGVGLPDIRNRCFTAHGRQVRTGVI